VAPFHSGTLWIYRDPAKDFRKVDDFDVGSWRPGLRELYERSAAASAAAETILAGAGGGGTWEAALSIAERTLNALEGADEKGCRPILIHFLWNWADLLGVRPGLDCCASCACKPGDDEVLWFVDGEGILCKNCAAGDPARGGSFAPFGSIILGPGARRWLLFVENMDPASLDRISLDAPSLGEAENLVTAVLESALGKRPASWQLR
jgi:DNA repair protein RecO (recombination protein O)